MLNQLFTRRSLLTSAAILIGTPSRGISAAAASAEPVIVISPQSVFADASSGTVIGTLSADGDLSWTFTLTNDAEGMFFLSGANLLVGSSVPLDHKAVLPSITVQATAGGRTITRTMPVHIRQPLPKDSSSLTFASNRVSFPVGSQLAGERDCSALCHTMHVAPEYGVGGGMRLLFCNFYVDQSGVTLPEKKPGTFKTIDFVTLFVGDAAYPVTFNGAESVVIRDGGFEWSDVVMAGASELMMPPRQLYYVRVGETTPAGQRRVFNAGQQLEIGRWANWSTGEGVEYSPSPVLSKRMSGSVSAYRGGTQSIAPSMIVAKGWDGSPVYALFGDSIGAAVGDFGSDLSNRGVLGHIGRALDDEASGRRSYANLCAPGTKPQDQSDDAEGQMALRLASIQALPNQPFTKVISRMGQNGIFAPYGKSFPRFGSIQPANLQDAMFKWWAFLRNQFACDIYQLTITPRTQNVAGSNSAWTAPALQKPTDSSVDGFPTGTRFQFNDWLLRSDAIPPYVRILDDRVAFYSPRVPYAWREVEGNWTLATSVAAEAATLSFDGENPPPQGAVFIIEPRTANVDVRTCYRVVGNGPWLVYVTGGGKAHDAGVEIRAASTADGLHPAQPLHIHGANVLIARKLDGTLP